MDPQIFKSTPENLEVISVSLYRPEQGNIVGRKYIKMQFYALVEPDTNTTKFKWCSVTKCF
jgi:hypothetical protein